MAEAQLTNQLSRIDTMTNVELRAELKRRGCPTSGNKKDLLAKLRVALQKEYEQAALETASTASTLDSMSFDGRINNFANLQQSPVVSHNRTMSSLNNSTASSNNYMTPNSGSPMVYSQQMHTGEIPLTYTNLQMHDQAVNQHPSIYNLPMQQTLHQSPAPMIPVPQQLTISPSEPRQMYNQSLLHNQQQQQQQFYPPMNTLEQHQMNLNNPSISPTIPAEIPAKRTRTRSKKTSVDSQPTEIEQPMATIVPQTSITNLPTEILNSIPDVQLTNTNEQFIDTPSANINNKNNIEENSFVSKSIEEEQKDIEPLRHDRGESRSSSVGSSSTKSESVIKEIPLSGDRHRLSRSKSPKSRWHHSPSPQQPPQTQQETQPLPIDTQVNSGVPNNNDEKPSTNEQIEKSSTVTLFAEESGDLGGDVKKTETSKKEGDISSNEPEKPAAQQQLKPSRSQTSSSSSSLMKSLNRITTSNRVNLSSDVLKTLIPDISLAPESIITDELEDRTNEQNNVDELELSTNQNVLETSIGNGFLLSDSMTIGDLADQKQQRNRTVVIDVAVDSSSLNDDLNGNSSDNRKKTSIPNRVASFESKTLIDGKTNALMMDEPVRVKDATTALEPPSQILYIRGLTRPFTLPLLKELLGRYGSLVDGEFWLDKIKSQCFATYQSLEDAQNAREALDGCRWPSTNPKTLSVRFARQEEFEFSKTTDLSPDQMSIGAMDTAMNRLIQEKTPTVNKSSANTNDENKITNNKKNSSTKPTDIREWDLPKLQQEKEKSPVQRQVIEEPAVKPPEQPAKGLDDYFRKTKAKPCIYWLPLTEEQIVDRARRAEERKAERDEEQRKRQLDENSRSTNNNNNNNKDNKSRSDNSTSNRPPRRSVSPRDKRRRVSSSTSPSRRDNKRR